VPPVVPLEVLPDGDPPLGTILGSVTTIVLPLGEVMTCEDELVFVSEPGGRVTITCCG